MKMQSKQRGFIWVEQFFQDIRFSLRMLRKNPVFTAIAVISLALAIGVNCGVFSIVNALLFRPLFPLRPNEVVNVYTKGATDFRYRNFSFSEFSLLRESDDVFADVSALNGTTVSVGVNTNAETRWKEAIVVSDNYFSMLGVIPAAGRFFLPEESRPNAKIPVVVVSQSLWESMGGGIDLGKRTLAINGEVCTIVGVAPKGFGGGSAIFAIDIWLPMGMASVGSGQDLANSSTFALYIMARLQPGLTLKAAKARLPFLVARLTTIAEDADEGKRTLEIGPPSRSTPLLNEPLGGGPFYLFYLVSAFAVGMAGVVLLAACLNLANMFLARNTTRSDELAVRLALGASRRRVIRILFVEGLILALMGGAAGMLISRLGNAFLLDSLMGNSAFTSWGLSLSLDTTPDIRVLLATLLFCVIATLVFAVAPARHAIREIAKGNLSLQHSTRTTTDRWGRLFSRPNCLLMAQLALSLALLFSGGLFFRAANSAARLEPGFEPEGDLVAEIDYSLVDRGETSMRTTIANIAEELRASPGVRKVALASSLPFDDTSWSIDVTTAGATGKRVRTMPTAVSSGYFDALGVKLRRGRDFTDQECLEVEGPSVVIIDQGMADALFPGEDPLGKYIKQIMGPNKTISQTMEIVGVVSAHWNGVLEESPPLRVFFPLASQPPQHVYVHVRGQTADAAKSGSFREMVRRKLLSLDPDIPLKRLTSYPDILDGSVDLWLMRFAAVLFGIFGAIALLLAVIGVYGVRAFVVARRMREIGIRMALGASPQRIYTLLMKQGAAQIVIGLGVGLVLSLTVGKLLASMIFHVSPGDPLVLGIVALILVLVALLATWLPSRRAAKVDPMEVLRWE